MKMTPSSTTNDHQIDNNNNSDENDNVSSINAVELDVQDSKIGSSSQLICKNEDTYDPQKQYTSVQNIRYFYCGELNSEVSIFRNYVADDQRTNGSFHPAIQHDEQNFYGMFNFGISVFNHRQPSPTNMIYNFDLNDNLEYDEDDFKFYQQLTSEVALYKLVDNTPSSTMSFDN